MGATKPAGAETGGIAIVETGNAYHRLEPPRLANVPEELRTGQQFVCWREAIRKGKRTKPPVNAHTGKDAKSDNPETWATLDEAVACYQKHKNTLYGVGRVFDPGDGMIGIDFDDCLDEHGELIPDHPAAKWLSRLNSYTEISPSGTGVKVWVHASHDLGGQTGRNNKDKGVEIYRERKYFTLTGQRFSRFSAKVEHRQAQVEELYREIFPPKEPPASRPADAVPPAPDSTDADIIARASKARNGAKFYALWSGDISGYGSQSEADAALCALLWFWTGDRQTVRRLFGQSVLGQREKWQRRDYQEATLDRTCRGEVYTPPLPRNNGPSVPGCTDPMQATVLDQRPNGAALDETLVWPELEDLGSELPPVPAFDPGLLPSALRPMVEDVAERMQVPIDFPAVAAIAALAGVCGRRALIQPKERDSSWIVVPNLWGGIVAPPGAMKSPVISSVMSPARAIETDWRREYEESVRHFESEQEMARLDRQVWQENYKRARKDQKPEPEKPALNRSAPSQRRLIAVDATFESLHKILSSNPAGMFVLRDELSGWLAGLERQGRESERAFFLECWNGDSSFTIDRIGRGSIHVEHCCVSLFGGIQPAKIRAYLADALRDGPTNDGLIQRFQLLVWPDRKLDWTYQDRCQDVAAATVADSVFRRIARLDPQSPLRLRFSSAAQGLFRAWLSELETRLRGNDLDPAIAAHLAKYRKLMPALSLLFSLADESATTVALPHAQQAADWCSYLEQHAYRVYASRISPERLAAMSLARRLTKGWKRDALTFTLREVYLNGWSGLSTPEEAASALWLLEDAGWVRKTTVKPRTGRPSECFTINPRVGGSRGRD
jgi:putative DNA primase/helicase